LVYAAGSTGNTAPIGIIACPHTGLISPASIAVDGQGAIYVANITGSDSGNVEVFPPFADGDTQPQRIISGDKTGLYQPHGITVDNQGNIYVSNTCGNPGCSPFPFHDDTIVIFSAAANGNVTPNATITGDQTGLNRPFGLTIIPPDP